MSDPEQTESPARRHRPPRFLKFVFDLPSGLYEWGLGWMLGKRLLALTHIGRNSDKPYKTVLEVVGFDRETEESVVVSAYGAEADWYKNIRAEPASRVETGRLDYSPQQRILTRAEARETAARFCRDHPWEAKLIPRVLPSIGAAIQPDPEASPVDLLASLPMVAFRPKG